MHKYVRVVYGNEAVGGGIHFPSKAQEYSYFNHDAAVEVGDIVVVFAGKTLKFGQVRVATSDERFGKAASKWIVCRVDLDKWQAATQLTVSEGEEK